jgi:glucose/arabinose dehydrogenase
MHALCFSLCLPISSVNVYLQARDMPKTSKDSSQRRFLALLATAGGLLVCLLSPTPAAAQSVQLTPFGGQTYASPFYVAGDPSDPSRVFVVEAAGRIQLVENGVTDSTAFLDINADVFDRSAAEGNGCECGMFSMALAPDFATSGLFYVFYTRDSAVGGEQHYLRIEEFRRSMADPDVADVATRRIVLEIPHLTASNHNGGQLQFGPDGLLYISVGDGGNTPDEARSLTSLLGKLLRINPNGGVPFPTLGSYSIPAGNPFADGPGGNADEIYSYGLRNPYRFSFDRLTGDLTIGDVGQSAWEEVDFLPNGGGLGANFGWNCFEGTLPYSGAPGGCTAPPSPHTPPVLEYANPTVGGAAVTGGYVVRDLTVPSLLGRYVYTDSSGALGTNIYSAVLFAGGSSGNGPTGLNAGGVVSFGEDACGHVYVVGIGGTVSRIEPTGGSPACMPQLAAPGSAGTDKDPPDLSVNGRKARRAAAKGAVRMIVSCDEACTVSAQGEIKKPGPDIGLDPDSASLVAGGRAALRLDLSRAESKRLARLLRRGRRARAVVELVAADSAGNSTPASRAVKQKR